MKCKKFNLAILMMVVAAFISVAVVSCKKDNEANRLVPTNTEEESFAPPQVDDMNAYLKGFKEKMKSSTKGEDEMLSLEEAAWHLSSLANYDFANASMPFNDIRFDTLYSTIPITEGAVLMSDFAASYGSISTDIDKYYHSLSFNEKHFRFINASISEEGTVTVSLVTTFIKSSKDLDDHLWYYDDLWDLSVDCENFFEDYPYISSTTMGAPLLKSFLNWKISHPLIGVRYYYTVTNEECFYYRDHIDPYGSPCYMNSRLFANNRANLDIRPIIYYLCDSALGLGVENCPLGLYIICWDVVREYEEPFTDQYERFWKEHYKVCVTYGERHEDPVVGGSINY